MTVVKEKSAKKFVPTLTCDVDIVTFHTAELGEDGGLKIVFGNPNITKGQLVTLVDRRKEILTDPEVIELVKWTDDEDHQRSRGAKLALCNKLSARPARVHFDRRKQELALFPVNGQPPKGSLFAGVVQKPFQIKNKEGCVMHRGLYVGGGKSILVLLVKEPVSIEHKNGRFRVEPPKSKGEERSK